MKPSLKKSKILEAKRYYQNAKNELKKAKLKEQYYQDNKYVRSAGDFAWEGVLFATEYLFEKLNFEYKPQKKGRRITIDYYNNAFNTLLNKKC